MILVVIGSVKLVLKILETYKTILHNKTSNHIVIVGVALMKLILEKLINLAQNGRHIELQKTAKEFLDQLFYLRVERLDEVLTLVNDDLLRMLEKLWAGNKDKVMRRDTEDKEADLKVAMDVQYEHLPLIHGKFFGVYEPYVLKNIFNPEVQAAKLQAIQLFHAGFEQEEAHLHKYLNVIYKVVVKFLPERHLDLLLLLKKIMGRPGKNNVINLAILPEVLLPQLSSQQVPYRREVREVMKTLNLDIPRHTLAKYEQELEEAASMGWLQLYEILGLLEHWIDANMEDSYPPTLNPFLPMICRNSQNGEVAKVKDKALELLLMILDRYGGYRENL